MTDRPVFYSPSPSSRYVQGNELQQYITVAMSVRERDGGRLSPEPRHEIMRPVSPFLNKRHLIHQQTRISPQIQPLPLPQTTSHPSVSHPNTHSTNQPATPGSRVQHNSPSVVPSRRARINRGAYKDNESAQKSNKEVDIVPALKMMNFERKAITPPSSDAGHSGSSTQHSTLQIPNDRREQNRSTSPETGRRKNPGWRKPAPKYIPTPPSTPPTTMYERLPSSRNDSSSVSGVHSVPTRMYTDPSFSTALSTPARPQRTVTDHQTPAMFRDMTGSLDHSRSRAPMRQTTKPSATVEKLNRAKNSSASLPNSSQIELPAQRQPAPIVYIRPPSTVVPVSSNLMGSNPMAKISRVDSRAEGPRPTIVHPQPKKVPSLTQLVAMVLPSRSPSPTPPSKDDISLPIPLAPLVGHGPSLAPPALRSMSRINNGSSSRGDNISSTAPLLRPPLVNAHSSSRPSSPQPRVSSQVPAPAPVRTRSPTPAVIPQYAPPKPPFPPPPPNTPIVSPKARNSAIFQANIISKLDESATNVAEKEPHDEKRVVSERPVDTPSEHIYASPAIVQSESGLATPPTTPPGVNTNKEVDERKPSPFFQNKDTMLPRNNSLPPQLPVISTSIDATNKGDKDVMSGKSANEDFLVSRNTTLYSKTLPSAQVSIGETSTKHEQLAPRDAELTRSRSPRPQKLYASTVASGEPVRKQKSLSYSDLASQSSRPRSPYSNSGVAPSASNIAYLKKTDFRNASTPDIRETSAFRARPHSPQPNATIHSVPAVEVSSNNAISHSIASSQVPSQRELDPHITRVRTPQPRATAVLVHATEKTRKDATPLAQAQNTLTDVKTLSTREIPSTTRTSTTTPPFTNHSNTPATIINPVRELSTPPLPSDWKETITRVKGVPAGDHKGEDGNDFPQPVASKRVRQEREDPESYLSDTWLQDEHASSSDQNQVPFVNEVKVRLPADLPDESDGKVSIRPPTKIDTPAPKESAPTLDVKPKAVQEQNAPNSSQGLTPPARSRSPVLKKKPPVQITTPELPLKHENLGKKEVTNETSKDDEWSLVFPGAAKDYGSPRDSPINTTKPITVSDPILDLQPPKLSDTISDRKRKTRETNFHPDGNSVTQSGQNPSVKAEAPRTVKAVDFAFVSQGVNHDEYIPQSSPSRCVSPPPRDQSKDYKKQLPLVIEPLYIESYTESEEQSVENPRAVTPVPMSQSTAHQNNVQILAKSHKSHGHALNKRLPEVQNYRPPTPPTHYRKKRSDDMLLGEPIVPYVKPATHLIYPDTSNSYEPSFSADSNVLGSRSPAPARANINDNSIILDERPRVRSPSPISSGTPELEEYELSEVETFPQLPPKTYRVREERRPEYTIQQATRVNNVRNRRDIQDERSSHNVHDRRPYHYNHVSRAARSQSDKLPRSNKAQPVVRSRSTPIPSTKQPSRRGFWSLFGAWAKVFVSKVKNWTSSTSVSAQNSFHHKYSSYDDDD